MPALARRVQSLVRADRPGTTTTAHGVLLRSRALRVGRRRVATVVAGVSASQLQTLSRTVLVGSIAMLVLTLLVGAVAIQRAPTAALRSVAQMTREAEEWDAHDLERGLDLGPDRDEITALAATLDLLQRIASSRRHEQRFASEVAHAPRTPLVAIRGIAELSVTDSHLGSTRGRRSRRSDVSPTASVRRSTRGPRYRRSTSKPAAIIFRSTVWVDDGPGVDPELRSSIFHPGVRTTGDGAGLGLALARRLAESCGRTVVLGDGLGGCFVLRLPASGVLSASGVPSTEPARG